MDPEKAKLISSLIDKIPIVIPILFTSVISIVTLIIGYKTGKRQNSLNLITTKRIEWQETIRDEIAEFLKDVYLFYFRIYTEICNNNNFKNDIESYFSVISKVSAEGNKLILRLNPIDDAKIIEIIKELLNFDLPEKKDEIIASFEKIKTLLAKLIDESHTMLKKEWEKIKLEAGHKRRRKLPN